MKYVYITTPTSRLPHSWNEVESKEGSRRRSQSTPALQIPKEQNKDTGRVQCNLEQSIVCDPHNTGLRDSARSVIYSRA